MGLLLGTVIVAIMQSNEIDIDTGFSAAHPLRICVVTETYPPDVNGVALTLARVVQGLRARAIR